MSQFEIEAAIGYMNRVGLHGAQHVQHFEAYAQRRDGKEVKIVIEVRDSGPSLPMRYMCVARTEDGKTASGNSQPSVESAIGSVHWGQLDD